MNKFTARLVINVIVTAPKWINAADIEDMLNDAHMSMNVTTADNVRVEGIVTPEVEITQAWEEEEVQ